MRRMFKVVVADDHLRFRQEIKKILMEIPAVEAMAEAGEGGELFELLGKLQPDLVLLDISMPNLRAIQATQTIKSNYPNVKVIIMIMDTESEYLYHAIKAGADGVLRKQDIARDLTTAILKMRRGERCFPEFHEEPRSKFGFKTVHRVGFLGISTFC